MADHWDRGLPPQRDPPGWLIATLCGLLLAALALIWITYTNTRI
ncbi:hypothetical protein [Xanthomonas floridensis]|uniref:Uncharacterized protein n=1 Tax=Xanthomonas floridensis TaxID=1843580 RepID=A0ABU5PUL3_9XANT|nr:hypothetical protein [Xanthomonas floridensis]MEA5123296.1 hypothetical protein [Xanthomonas floridensis]MEA5132737.1 hypothetical protein [Xanthomonas floridensis]